jgi:hypothetical protein
MNNKKIEFFAIMSDEISMKSGAHPTSVLALRLVCTESLRPRPVMHHALNDILRLSNTIRL